MAHLPLSRRAFGAALTGALASAALPAAADGLSLAEISNYLNMLQSSRATFTQLNEDGSQSTGTVSIKRPGRMRFDYDPPTQALVLASGGEVAIFDGKMGGRPDRYPLGRTPLKHILQRNVNLQAAGIVTDHVFDGTSTIVRAQDPRQPDDGSIELFFSDGPIALRQWVMRTDGGTTTVVLGEMEQEVDLPNVLFSIQHAVSEL